MKKEDCQTTNTRYLGAGSYAADALQGHDVDVNQYPHFLAMLDEANRKPLEKVKL